MSGMVGQVFSFEIGEEVRVTLQGGAQFFGRVQEVSMKMKQEEWHGWYIVLDQYHTSVDFTRHEILMPQIVAVSREHR